MLNLADLPIYAFRQLSYLAFVNMPRDQYVYRYAEDYCDKYNVTKEEYVDTLVMLMKQGFVDSHHQVTKAWYMKVVMHMLTEHHVWKREFGTLCGYRYGYTEYLWQIASYIMRGYIEKAAGYARPLVGVSGAGFNMYPYLQPLVGENPDVMVILPEDKMAEMVAEVNYQMFVDERLTEESMQEQMKAVPVGKERYEMEDMMGLYRYMMYGVRSEGNGTRWAIATEAIAKLYDDNIDGAMELFGKALAVRKGEKKKVSFEVCPILNYFYGVCMMRWNRADKTGSGCRPLAEFLKSSKVKLNPELFHIRLICNYAEVSGSTMHGIIGKNIEQALEEDASVLSRQMAYLVMGYFGMATDDTQVSVSKPKYAIFQHELSPYLSLSPEEKEALRNIYGGKPLLSKLRRKEPWEELLSDISYKASHIEKEAVEIKSHLYYFIEGMELNAVVKMHMDEDGRLTGDEVIARNQFMHLDFQTEDAADVHAAKALATKESGVEDVQAILPLLAESGRVMTGRYHDALFNRNFIESQMVREKPCITFNAKGDSINVTTNIDASCDMTLRNTVWMDDEGLYHMATTNALQRNIIAKFATMPNFPSSAIMAMRRTILSLNGIIDIKENIMSNDMDKALKGNGRLAVKISPDKLDFHFEMAVCPAGDGTLYFAPGVGEGVIYDEVDGLTQCFERDMAKELENFRALSEFFFEKKIAEFNDDYSGTIYTTSSLLLLISHVYDHQDQFYIEWPHGQLFRFRGSVGHGDVQITVKSGTRWFELDGVANVAGERKDLQQLLAMYTEIDENGFVRLTDDEYIRMTETLREHLERLNALPTLSPTRKRVPAYQVGALAKTIDKMRNVVDDEYTNMLNRVKEAYSTDYPLPEGLNATLREYQRDGYVWMRRLDAWGAGACLADDMGLGKTLQALAFLLSKADGGPSLAVMPKSVLPNWSKEIQNFAPQLNILVVNNATDRKSLVNNAAPYDIVLCTYGILVSETALLTSRKWNVVCLDEAHQIKNQSTMASQAAMKLNAQSRIALTGTPMQNHWGELWTLLQFLNPGLLGPWTRFYNTYIKPDITPTMIEEMQNQTQPFILRRTKEEVLEELPDKLVGEHFVEMSPEEKDVYEAMRMKAEVKFKDKALKTAAERAESKTIDLQFFDELTKLRLVSCSMQLVFTGWELPSSKITALMEMLGALCENPSNNILVFSQFTSFLSLIKKELDSNGYEYLYLDGQTSLDQRQQAVSSFQSGEKKLFLLSLKAGGLGVNLTAANYVILLDPWWNPAIENQAMDRAHRMGQKRCVSVIRLITKDSIEEKILRMHEKKQSLSNIILDGTSETYKLTYEDILDLVAPI